MEGLSINAYKGLRRYWKRRAYHRLDDGQQMQIMGRSRVQSSRKKFRVKLLRQNHQARRQPSGPNPSNSSRRRLWRWRWRWRVKISPKIRLMGWLRRLRDAYVNMMLSFANSAAAAYGAGGSVGFGGGGAFSSASVGFERPPLKEYDEKMIVEIYKSVMMAQGQIVTREPGKLNPPSSSSSSSSRKLVLC